MRTLFALVILTATAHGQARWTPFEACTNIPKDRYGSSYGFDLHASDPVIVRRYAYPFSKPFLWHGDKIVSVKNKPVSSSTQALQMIDAVTQKTIPIKVERTYANGDKKTVSVTLERSEYARMEGHPKSPNINWPLPNAEADTFGLFEADAEWVGQTVDPVTKRTVDCFKLPSGVRVPKGLKGTANRLGVFMLRERRPESHITDDIVIANFPRDQWKTGQPTHINRCLVWVEPEQTVQLNGEETKVAVLSLIVEDQPSPILATVP